MAVFSAPVLVFDLDGTIAETAGDLMGALNATLAREGVATIPLSEARFLLGAGGRALIQRGFAMHGAPLDQDRLESLFIFFLAYYEAHIANESFLFPGLIPALDHLAAEGWDFAVCTNKTERPARKLLKALGVADRFKAITGQDTFGVAKPDPQALAKTILAAGGDPKRAIMVGDSHTDVDTAKALGIPVVAVDFGYTDRPIAEYAPDVVISHFDRLPEVVEGLKLRLAS